MSDLNHRVGVREQNLVVRNLKLSNVTEESCDELVKEIDFTETQKDSFNIELSCGGVNYNFIII